MVSKSVVRARLRQGKDDDLRAAIEELIAQGHDEADLVRAGLRQLLGLGSPGPVSYTFTAVDRHPAAPTAEREHKKSKQYKTAPPIIEKLNTSPVDNSDDDLDRLLGL
jgi:hypothetical protein